MLTSRIYKHHPEGKNIHVSTKKIQISDGAILYFQIHTEQSAVIALLESHIVELCADFQLRKEKEDVFFSKLLSGLNRLMSSQSNTFSKARLRAFLWVIQGNELSFSICGNYQVYLEQEDQIIDIADGMSSNDIEFSYVSSWSILPGNSLFISNRDLLGFLTKEDLEEFDMDHDPSVIEALISREAPEEVIDCLIFFHEENHVPESIKRFQRSGPGFVDTALALSSQITNFCKQNIEKFELKGKFDSIVHHPKVAEMLWKKPVRVGLLGSWVVVCITLLVLIVRSVFYTSMETAVPEEYKAKLIEAEQIIGRSTRDMANRDLFKENLSKAETLVFEVRDKKMFSNDVKTLLEKISVLKRQLNGIESVSLDSKPVDFPLPEGSTPVALLENAKKNYVVTEKGILGPFVKGNELKIAPFPDNEIAKSADMTPEGNIYVLTTNNKILRYSKGEFVYVNVEGQTTWEASSAIKAFIGNIYLLSEDGSQIFKHRPGVVGFSAKTPLVEGSFSGKTLLDFTIDGGFYVVQSDLTVEKYTTAPKFAKSGVVLNRLPDNYRMSQNHPIRVYTTASSNFVYMLLDGRVWIFEPDSRTFKNVRGIKYVGQIEVTGQSISSILAPKDGEITVLTEKGISNIKFEISDSKLILR